MNLCIPLTVQAERRLCALPYFCFTLSALNVHILCCSFINGNIDDTCIVINIWLAESKTDLLKKMVISVGGIGQNLSNTRPLT